tara:strand:+ start:166 stop:459 length:294 start_codon:yes stop_codon:yes gene_type:complete
MSHWAELDSENKVIRVLVGDNNESDEGEAFMNSLGGNWVKTSYNNNIRFNFAGIGYTYDPIDDAFIAPMPECGHEELHLNELKRWECSNAEHIIELS